MTGAAARARMTMRTTIYRNAQTEKDPYGKRKAPRLDDGGTSVACYAWNARKATIEGLDKLGGAGLFEGVHEDLIIMFPKNASILATDRLGDITDRQGAVLFSGPWLVDAVARRATHFEGAVRRVGSQP